MTGKLFTYVCICDYADKKADRKLLHICTILYIYIYSYVQKYVQALFAYKVHLFARIVKINFVKISKITKCAIILAAN